ncbi:alpha/beta hydrolase [Streptomyces sp. 549]|uniref:alpha/beta fold hydrolase n=1 Tax=Streptomyces sp. 549 TaxID=3049076 RepID=UPI0024C228E6|nr:alpha/beta fold hydrolase [Streptomyces sp. 549]MDK1476777.1 alpha/beta hydrolase [Streptomyces sp. 549]
MQHVPLDIRVRPATSQAAVLLLHGGRADALEPPTRWNLPARRLGLLARALGRAAPVPSLVIAAARYRHRGWNGGRADPAADARAALRALAEACGPLPVVLVGHSMGARAALRVADAPHIAGVVGLAPWCPPGEPVTQLAGRTVVLVHGDRDRVTDPRQTWAFAARARAAGSAACGVVVPGGDHAMVRSATDWHRITAAAVRGLLDPARMPAPLAAALTTGPDSGPVGGPHGDTDSDPDGGAGVRPGRTGTRHPLPLPLSQVLGRGATWRRVRDGGGWRAGTPGSSR